MVAAMALDTGKSCGNDGLWTWITGMSTILAFMVMFRLMLAWFARSKLREIKRDGVEGDGTADSGYGDGFKDWGAFFGFCQDVMHGRSKEFFVTLSTYDSIVGSVSYGLVQVLAVLSFLW